MAAPHSSSGRRAIWAARGRRRGAAAGPEPPHNDIIPRHGGEGCGNRAAPARTRLPTTRLSVAPGRAPLPANPLPPRYGAPSKRGDAWARAASPGGRWDLSGERRQSGIGGRGAELSVEGAVVGLGAIRPAALVRPPSCPRPQGTRVQNGFVGLFCAGHS